MTIAYGAERQVCGLVLSSMAFFGLAFSDISCLASSIVECGHQHNHWQGPEKVGWQKPSYTESITHHKKRIYSIVLIKFILQEWPWVFLSYILAILAPLCFHSHLVSNFSSLPLPKSLNPSAAASSGEALQRQDQQGEQEQGDQLSQGDQGELLLAFDTPASTWPTWRWTNGVHAPQTSTWSTRSPWCSTLRSLSPWRWWSSQCRRPLRRPRPSPSSWVLNSPAEPPPQCFWVDRGCRNLGLNIQTILLFFHQALQPRRRSQQLLCAIKQLQISSLLAWKERLSSSNSCRWAPIVLSSHKDGGLRRGFTENQTGVERAIKCDCKSWHYWLLNVRIPQNLRRSSTL